MYPLRAVDLYIQVKIICTIHQMAKMKLPLSDSDLLYAGDL